MDPIAMARLTGLERDLAIAGMRRALELRDKLADRDAQRTAVYTISALARALRKG